MSFRAWNIRPALYTVENFVAVAITTDMVSGNPLADAHLCHADIARLLSVIEQQVYSLPPREIV